MRTLTKYLFLFLFLVPFAHRTSAQGSCANFAAGVCPSAPYAPTNGVTHFYFVDSGSGSDGNSGASESSPWAHTPGMPTYTGSHTPAAGDGYILKGCSTWSNSSLPVNWTHSGTSANHIYIGVDPGWFGTCATPSAWAASTTYQLSSLIKPTSGNAGGYTFAPSNSDIGTCASGSTQPAAWPQTVGATVTDGSCTWYNAGLLAWGRPIFDAGGAIINPPECTNVNAFLILNSTSFVDARWVELRKYHWNSPNVDSSCRGLAYWVGVANGATNDTIGYLYLHAWTAGTCGVGYCGLNATTAGDISIGIFLNNCQSCTADHIVADNSDGTWYTGLGVQWPMTNSILKYQSNALKPLLGGTFSGNDISHIGESPSNTSVHPNCIETVGNNPPNLYYIVSNRVHDMTGTSEQCETLQLGNNSETDYVVDNVFYNLGGGDIMRFPQGAPKTPNALYFLSNTFVSSGGGTCGDVGSAGNSWSVAFVMDSNHCITPSTPSGTSQSQLMISGTISGAATIQFTGNTTQLLSTANSGGYVNTTNYVYFPATGSSATVGQGTNLTATFWPAGIPTNDTAYACYEEFVSAVIQPVCPSRTSNTRPSSGPWDSGAYEFLSTPTAAAPSCVPSSGTVPQSVNCTVSGGAPVMCWSLSVTPATNGGSGCGTGTLYTGAIAISSPGTLKIIAGGTGFLDGSVASFTYISGTVPPAPATQIFSGVPSDVHIEGEADYGKGSQTIYTRTIAWNPVTTKPVVTEVYYDVYREVTGTNKYAKLNPSPLIHADYFDAQEAKGVKYGYYVTPWTPALGEGKPSATLFTGVTN